MKNKNNTAMLYNIALQCARLSDQGCSAYCEQCQFNIFNYVDDPREAALLKANAYTDYHSQKSAKIMADAQLDEIASTNNWVGYFGLAVLIGLLVWGCSACKSCTNSDSKTAYYHEQFYEEPTQTVTCVPTRIREVLTEMQKPGVVRDVNGDGLINCIDYSITFRRLFGSWARIIINNNPRTGFNHMFIEIWDPRRGPTFVEPQGTPDRYMMGLIWGVQFNPVYNRDVTSIWGD